MNKLLSALALAAIAFHAMAATYKWVDDKGVVHYSDTIPPDQVKKANAQLSRRGIIIKKTDAALTEAQQHALEEEQHRIKQQQAQEAEDLRRNKLLLETYSNEDEIEAARNRALEAPDGRIKLAKDRLKAVGRKDDELTDRVKWYETKRENGAGKGTPPVILKQLADLRTEKSRLDTTINQAEKEKTEIAANFESDKLRFRELRAGNVDLSKAIIPNKPTEKLVTGCFEAWYQTLINNGQNRAYVVGSDIERQKEPVELALDIRSRDAYGQFTSLRIACPLRADGTIDLEGTTARRNRYIANR
jgi:hypothetical protein